MSFQAYLDSIKAKTGMDPADFRVIAEQKGLLADGVKSMQLVNWLSEDYDLGRGHAMAIVATLTPVSAKSKNPVEVLDSHFAGGKAHWRAVFDSLLETLRQRAPVETSLTNTYISLLRGSRKFAIVAMTANRMDVGIKLTGVEPTDRLEAAGSWNSMVTHRVRLSSGDEVDAELVEWLARAYDAAE